MNYLLNVIIGFDQLITTLIGGYPDETLSSYAWRMDIKGKKLGRFFRQLIDFLFSWQNIPEGHCYAAMMEEKTRKQVPPELRGLK
jgi:hypothetical protein